MPNHTPSSDNGRPDLPQHPTPQSGAREPLFRLPQPSGQVAKALFPLLGPLVGQLLGLPGVNAMYEAVAGLPMPDFLNENLRKSGIRVNLSFEDATRIPAEGPLVVVANHPFGAIEGVILASMLFAARPDVKLLANYLLAMMPEMAAIIFNIDPFGGDGSQKRNITPLKEAIRWLKAGHCLGVFPAGEVSSLNLRQMAVQDPAWNPSIGRMAKISGATVLPVYFAGRNSVLFQLMGLIHPRLRTIMLGRELLRCRGTVIDVRIGSPVPASKIKAFETDEDVIRYLRTRTYILKHRVALPQVAPAVQDVSPLAAPLDGREVEAELKALPPEAVIFENEEYLLVLGRRAQMPKAVLELGRLREETFRSVGEGSGNDRDLDRFDDYYLHLCLWHKPDREIAGGYRLGPTDEILPKYGPHGLYSATLFHYKAQFLEQITPALEVGRSFVRREYQRSYFPLLTLWKGIAQYVGRNPQYRFLFGPVSISNSYTPFARSVLVKFLNSHAAKEESRGLRHLVRAKLPPRVKAGPNWRELRSFCNSVEDLGTFISEVERDQKGVPVLLRQYLKLGGKILAFNVDPAFMNAIDGLILVDLAQTDAKILQRYMGAEGYKAFMDYHRD